MAGNRHGQSVGAAGLGHGPDRFRRTDAPGELGIAHRLACRDLLQRTPDALLERGAAHVERQIESQAGGLHQTHHLGNQLLEPGVAADQPGMRELVLEIPRELAGIVAHENGAHATIALRDQDRPESALADGEMYSVFSPPARYFVGVMPSN